MKYLLRGNYKPLLFLLVIMLLCFFINGTIANAADRSFIYLNELKNVSVSSGSYQCYTYTPQTNQFFVVETFGNYDTKIKVTNTTTGTIIDDDSGVGNNARIYFQAIQNQTLYIYTQIWGYGSATYQIQLRKQTFSMFAFNVPDDINTIPDLVSPYSSFSSIFDCKQYENVEASYALQNDERFLARVNSEIFFFSGHGTGNDSGSTQGGDVVFYNSTYISTSTNLNMSRAKVAMWSACFSANDHNTSFNSVANYSVQCGAISAVGFLYSVYPNSARTFTDWFFYCLSDGCTVTQSAADAASMLWNPWDNVRDYVVFGNGNVVVTDSTISNSSFYTGSKGSINIPFENYICIKTGNIVERYYELINGCISNNLIDVYYDDGGRIISIKEHINDYSDILPQNTDVLKSEERITNNILLKRNYDSYEISNKHIVYYLIDKRMVPLMITSVNAKKGSYTSQAFVCINLSNGIEINYDSISTLV